MNVRTLILIAAGALVASSAGAQGTAQDPQPDRDGPAQTRPAPQTKDSGETTKEKAERSREKARELGAKGQEQLEKGGSAARRGANAAGQAVAAKVVGTKTVTGRISDVSKEHVTLQRSSDGQPMNLRVTESTKVTIAGQKKPAGSLQQGAEVRASYVQSGGEATAMKIDVEKTPGGAASDGSRAEKRAKKAPGGTGTSGSSGDTRSRGSGAR